MIYRKRGAAVRWENGTIVRVTESGWAREEGELFECAPDAQRTQERAGNGQLATGNLTLPDLSKVAEICERLIVTRGIAEHEYGARRWTEETDRVHASLVKGTLRALLDTTTPRLDELLAIGAALERAEEEEREPPPRLRLAPNVTAALLPLLAGLAPPNVRLRQSAGAIDGYGNPVTEESVSFYRPSYRVRPVRMPFDLRLECEVTAIDRTRPVAIALLAPATGLVLRVLIRDGERVYPSRVRVTRIDAVSDERVWYPYGAGSFGAELML